jgi:hypothetical protein
MFANSKEMSNYVRDVLEKKNIQNLPRTLASRMDDFKSAEFFGKADKMETYGNAIRKFCEALASREYKSLPETMKADELPLETLQNKAITHARLVRELSHARQVLAEMEQKVTNSEAKIPYTQRDVFGKLLVELQNAITE